MKSAEQILKEHHIIDSNNTIHSDLDSALKAIQEYADQFSPAIKEGEVLFHFVEITPELKLNYGETYTVKEKTLKNIATVKYSYGMTAFKEYYSHVLFPVSLPSSQLKPSDEDIEKQAEKKYPDLYNQKLNRGFRIGAIQMRDNPESFLRK